MKILIPEAIYNQALVLLALFQCRRRLHMIFSDFAFHNIKLKGALIILVFLLCSGTSFGQLVPVPSGKPFRLTSFYEIIFKNHPIAKQANLMPEIAKQELRMARGTFDPKIGADFLQKQYNDKDYYNNLDAYLKVPVWTNTDLKVGRERNTGVFLNSSDNVPEGGLTYAGIEIPIGQGLFIDQRRAMLRQAQIFQTMAVAEQQKMLNKLILSAAKDYWNWYFSYRQLILADSAFVFAQQNYNAVRQRVVQGDLANIDSVEAKIFLQDRIILLQQSKLDWQNASLQLANYLWLDNNQPAELADDVNPELTVEQAMLPSEAAVNELFEFAKANHPELVKAKGKINQLDIDRRLSVEMLKPVLNVQYNFLTRPDGTFSELNILQNNYKAGVNFSFPLFLRKERGKLQLVKTKLLQSQNELSQLNRDIITELNQSNNNIRNMRNQLDVVNSMVVNHNILLRAEVRKFENGESSLFLVNSRQSKFIEAQVKQASLVSKLQKEKAMLYWAAGANEFSGMGK